jgi:hypothetical protein
LLAATTDDLGATPIWPHRDPAVPPCRGDRHATLGHGRSAIRDCGIKRPVPLDRCRRPISAPEFVGPALRLPDQLAHHGAIRGATSATCARGQSPCKAALIPRRRSNAIRHRAGPHHGPRVLGRSSFSEPGASSLDRVSLRQRATWSSVQKKTLHSETLCARGDPFLRFQFVPCINRNKPIPNAGPITVPNKATITDFTNITQLSRHAAQLGAVTNATLRYSTLMAAGCKLY